MVMHARKLPRLSDGYFERNQAHPYENSGGKYSKSPFGDNCNDKSPAPDGPGSVMESPENSRRPSPRYPPHKASYTQRLKEREHHSEAKSPMSKERNNRSHSHHHSSSSGGGGSSQQHHSTSTPNNSSLSRSKSSVSENTSNAVLRNNHERSHTEDTDKDRRSQVGDWSEHVSSSGKKYYYNCRTEVSQWEKPKEWVDYEKIHGNQKTVTQPAEQATSNRNREKNNATTNRSSDRHSSSGSSNTTSRSSHPHRERDRDQQHHGGASSNRAHNSSGNSNEQRHGTNDQASSGSSSSSNSSNSSNSSVASRPRGHATNRRDESSKSSRLNEEETNEKSESRLNDQSSSRQERNASNHHQYHHSTSSSSSSHHQQNSARQTSSRKDVSQDMEISPDSSSVADQAQSSVSIRGETPRTHQIHSHNQSHANTPTGGNSSVQCRTTPKAELLYGHANSHPPLGTNISSTPSMAASAAAASAQLLSPSQVTLANLPRLISQLAGTRGLPNLSELSQHEALQTIQQALQLTKQLGGMNRSPHGSSAEAKALALSPAMISAALRGEMTPFYPLNNNDGGLRRNNDNCLSPSSDCHSHSSRQTSPASSAASPTSVGIPINNGQASVTTSVAAAIAAAAAAANSGGPTSSSMKPSTLTLTPSLSNYFREDLVTHVTGWQADHAERQACRYSEEAHNIGSLNCTRVSAELKMARSLVRLAEIQATLQEQRILFLRQQVKELEDRRSQNSFMMDNS